MTSRMEHRRLPRCESGFFAFARDSTCQQTRSSIFRSGASCSPKQSSSLMASGLAHLLTSPAQLFRGKPTTCPTVKAKESGCNVLLVQAVRNQSLANYQSWAATDLKRQSGLASVKRVFESQFLILTRGAAQSRTRELFPRWKRRTSATITTFKSIPFRTAFHFARIFTNSLIVAT